MAREAKLTFDKEKHEYQADGIVVPSVTQIIAPLVDYSHVPKYRLEIAADRGSKIHTATEFWDEGDLEEDELDPSIIPYLDAWKLFREQFNFVPYYIEKRWYHPFYKIAGTADRIGYCEMSDGRKVDAVVEVKTAARTFQWYGIQLAGYQLLYQGLADIKLRYVVKLNQDGTFRLFNYNDPGDQAVFLGLLNIHRWKEKHAS